MRIYFQLLHLSIGFCKHTHEVCVTRNYRYYLYNGSNVVTTIPNTMLYLVTATPQDKLGMCDFPETT